MPSQHLASAIVGLSLQLLSLPVLCPFTSKAASPPRFASSLTQYGITWFFEKPVLTGNFVNGDLYVVGPVSITNISPRPLWGAEVQPVINRESVQEGRYEGRQARHGSVLNPPADSKKGGYDSRIPSDRYDPTLFAQLPIRMESGDSLVSTVSRPNQEITRFSGQFVDPLKVGAVLSCLASQPPPGTFRPSYCDSRQSRPHQISELHRERLLKLKRPTGAPRSLDNYVQVFRKPWLDTVEFGFAAPVENLPHYGQEVVQLVGEASLLLLMDYPEEEKEKLLVPLIQVGIDFWGIARAGGSWPAHGGLNSGRKWPIILAGILLGDQDMQTPGKRFAFLHFAEDDQTAWCPYDYKRGVYERGWTGARAIFTGHSLEGGGGERGNWDKGWGPLDLFHPSDWPNRNPQSYPPSEGYRRANTSPAWVAQALAARLMGVESVWAHDAFFAYVDRWMTEDDTPFVEEMKAAGFKDLTGIPRGRFERQGYVWGPAFVREMWATYRNRGPGGPGRQAPAPAEHTWN